MSKPLTMEYRDLKDSDMSCATILQKGYGAWNKEYTLSHHTAGYECAGSCARYTEERWKVRYIFDNALHGKAFLTEKEAQEYFDAYTTPIICIPA